MFLLHILQSPGQEPESFCTLHIVSKTGHVWKRRVLLNSLIGPELTLFGNKFSDSSDIGFFCDQAAVDPQALVSSLPQVVKGHVAIVAFLAEERQQVETSDMYQSLAEVAVHKKPDRDSTVIATLLPHSQVKFLEEVELDSNTSMALVEAGGNHGFVLWRALGEPSCFFKTFPEILADALPDALPQEQEGGRSAGQDPPCTYKMRREALDLLHEASEAWLADLLRRANMLTIHRKQVTLKVEDI
ncbi:unnamed protein product, partial [Durusdinium trenchii]